MKFKDYPIVPEIKKAIAELGWNKPTDIQFKAIQPILDGEDVLAIAQTGTGKTASFVIPIVHQIARKQSKYSSAKKVSALVMVPTRELAKQIEGVFKELGKNTKVRPLAILGGVEQEYQIEQLRGNVDVVIATPGRLFDLISQGYLDVSRLDTLVLDEADHMLALGFIKDIKDLMRHVPQKRQTLFFSATIDKDIKKIAYDLVRNAIRIQISPNNPVAKNIAHSVTFVGMDDKRFFLENLIKENEEKKVIVFVRTKIRAERVVKAMERVGIKSETIHGDVVQKERFVILERFRTGENRVLITTDVAARGIDIPNVEAVVNYDLPDVPENYVHRVGRTGRGKMKGWAISFCSKEEIKLLREIEAYTGDKIEEYGVAPEDYAAIVEESAAKEYDWKNLMEQEDLWQKEKKKK